MKEEHVMLAIRTILHPTDFLEHSQHAYWLASALARDYGARLIALHVVAAPTVVYGEGVVPTNPEALQAEASARLAALPAPGGNVALDRRVVEGDAAEVTLRLAKELHADLIVMGTHGRTGLGRLLMGSVAERVLREANCPVLTVKATVPVPAPEGRPATAAPA
jgi:nucleotide-binding universal stress UspA family protein